MSGSLTRDRVVDIVRAFVTEHIAPSWPLWSNDADLRTLGADSLDIVDLAMVVEDAFAPHGVGRIEADRESFRTVNAITDLVMSRMQR